jgi:AcrR family transcriptional regulator
MAGKRTDNGRNGDLVEERRRQILDAASTVFARQGYHRARTREIAQEAGIAEGTIYKYFDSKGDLLLSLVQRVATVSLPQVGTLSEAGDLRSSLTALLTERLETLDRNRDLIKAVLPEIIGDRELREGYLRQVLLPTANLFLPLLQRKLSEAEFHPIDARVVLPAIGLGALGTLVANEYLELPLGRRLPREELVDELVELFLHGIQRSATETPDLDVDRRHTPSRDPHHINRILNEPAEVKGA